MPHVVVVKECHERLRRQPNAMVTGGGEAGVGLVAVLDCVPIGPHARSGVVRRAIVHHDNLSRKRGLPEDAVDGVSDHVAAIERGDDDADGDLSHGSTAGHFHLVLAAVGRPTYARSGRRFSVQKWAVTFVYRWSNRSVQMPTSAGRTASRGETRTTDAGTCLAASDKYTVASPRIM